MCISMRQFAHYRLGPFGCVENRLYPFYSKALHRLCNLFISRLFTSSQWKAHFAHFHCPFDASNTLNLWVLPIFSPFIDSILYFAFICYIHKTELYNSSSSNINRCKHSGDIQIHVSSMLLRTRFIEFSNFAVENQKPAFCLYRWCVAVIDEEFWQHFRKQRAPNTCVCG